MCTASGQCLQAAPTSIVEKPIVGKQKHTGFSLRVSGGVGTAGSQRDLSNGRERVSGVAGLASVDIGGTPIDNLIVYGHIGGLAFNHRNLSDSPGAGGAFLGFLGAGTRYHFMPIDWYASGTLALAVMSLADPKGTVRNAGPGVGIELETGKEWSADAQSSKWGVDLGLRFSYAHCPAGRADREPDKGWNSLALSLVFSVAYD